MELLSNKYDTLLDEIHNIKEECKDNQIYVRALEEKVDKLEKNSRSIHIKIKNIDQQRHLKPNIAYLKICEI